MKNCWATDLGSCSEAISKEHLVSKSLFKDTVLSVQGLPWCEDKPKKIGIASLTSKVLCVKHNNALPEVDAAGAHAFNVLREMRRLSNVRKKLRSKRWNVVRSTINGNLLERWFLKTMINITYSGAYSSGLMSQYVEKPTKELVQIAFGHQRFRGKAGLYAAAFEGQLLYSSDTVEFTPLLNHERHIMGAFFSFRGFRFLLSLIPEAAPKTLKGVRGLSEDWANSRLLYHPEKINHKIGKHLSHVVRFSWY